MDQNKPLWKQRGFPIQDATAIRLLDGSPATVQPYSYEDSKEKEIKIEREKKRLRIYRVIQPGESKNEVNIYDEFELVELIGPEEFLRIGGQP